MPDGGAVHTMGVTADTADPVTAARSALTEHKKRCRTCDAGLPCKARDALRAAWRQALRGAPATTTEPQEAP